MDTATDSEVAASMLAISSQLLEITSDLGWDQPPRLALLTSVDSAADAEVHCQVGADVGLAMGFPIIIEGHPCPSLAELGAQPDAAGAVLVTEGWMDAGSVAAAAESGIVPLDHVAPDGRLEVRTVIGVHRDGTRVQITQPRGGQTHTACGIAGRVPDALAMTVGIDADSTGVRLDDLLRRMWLAVSAVAASSRLGAACEPDASIDEVIAQLRHMVAEGAISDLDRGVATTPFVRLARLLARSTDGDPTTTWERLAVRLRNETSDTHLLMGWALSAAIDPFLLERWNADSERRARRWSGPGMLAHITEAGYPSWDDIDAMFGETHPRTRSYLQLLPDVEDIISDLAGNSRRV